MYSMTGFGSGYIAEDGRELRIELKSVNHRFLDVSTRLPRNIAFLEADIRKTISSRLKRGHVDVFVHYALNRDDSVTVAVNENLLKQYMSAIRPLAKKFPVKPRMNIETLLKIDALTVTEREDDQEAVRALCVKACERALDELVEARRIEGERLIADMAGRLGVICASLSGVAERAPSVPGEYKQKLEQRIAEWLNKGEVDPQRLAAEVAFFADRCNIDEEITRLGSHIENLKGIFSSGSGGEGIGRKLDFTLQEMNREANTIGSKANDITITERVMEIKGELEKIREQAQNIE